MLNKFILLFLFLFPVILFSQDSFTLFESKEVGGHFVGTCFMSTKYETVREQMETAPFCGRNIARNVYKKDTLHLKLIPKKDLVLYTQIDSMELIIKPEIPDTYITEKKKDTLVLSHPINNVWVLENELFARNSSSWINVNKGPFVYTELRENSYSKIKKGQPKEVQMIYYLKNSKEKLDTVCHYILSGSVSEFPEVPSRYSITERPILASPSRLEEKECLSNKDAEKILLEIKSKLILLGFYKGELNKEIDLEFIQAMTNFQKENDLPLGQFDLETIRFLGLEN